MASLSYVSQQDSQVEMAGDGDSCVFDCDHTAAYGISNRGI